MTGHQGELRSRDEIRDKVDQTAEDLETRGAGLEVRRSDVESVRTAVENMNFGGTSDAVEIMEGALDNAEQVIIDTAEQEGDELDDVQADNTEHGEELREQSDVNRNDAERIADTAQGVATQESVNELTKARDAVLEDIDHLLEMMDRATEAGERSEESQNVIFEYIRSGGRGGKA